MKIWRTYPAITVESGYIIHGIYHPAIYIGYFRAEPNFYVTKPSGYIIQPFGYIGHFESCERELFPWFLLARGNVFLLFPSVRTEPLNLT